MSTTENTTRTWAYDAVLDGTAEALEENRRRFDAALRENGWLLPTAAPGVDGLGGPFEEAVEGLNRAIRRLAQKAPRAGELQRARFPFVNGAQLLERTDYVASFPQLFGVIDTFQGDTRAHRKLLADVEAGEDWNTHLAPNGMSLVPAVCHPLYWSLQGTEQRGDVYELVGDCFRNEPSADPMRLVAFRMHELVLLGTPEQALEHRRVWLELGRELLVSLGLDITVVEANDPFFGRAGKMLAAGQREAQLKYELVTEVYPGHETAISSGNCHEAHFGENFSITAQGQPAHSACYGFGLERIVLALAATHGFDTAQWPQEVRALLDLED